MKRFSKALEKELHGNFSEGGDIVDRKIKGTKSKYKTGRWTDGKCIKYSN